MAWGCRRIFRAAAQWVRRAAEQGHTEAAYNLATLYVSGQGVERDLAEAAKWCTVRRPRKGKATAQSNLGVFYASGQGVPQDLAEAARWFRKAAEQGMPKPSSTWDRSIRKARWVAKDLVEAYKWLSLAGGPGRPGRR